VNAPSRRFGVSSSQTRQRRALDARAFILVVVVVVRSRPVYIAVALERKQRTPIRQSASLSIVAVDPSSRHKKNQKNQKAQPTVIAFSHQTHLCDDDSHPTARTDAREIPARTPGDDLAPIRSPVRRSPDPIVPSTPRSHVPLRKFVTSEEESLGSFLVCEQSLWVMFVGRVSQTKAAL